MEVSSARGVMEEKGAELTEALLGCRRKDPLLCDSSVSPVSTDTTIGYRVPFSPIQAHWLEGGQLTSFLAHGWRYNSIGLHIRLCGEMKYRHSKHLLESHLLLASHTLSLFLPPPLDLSFLSSTV